MEHPVSSVRLLFRHGQFVTLPENIDPDLPFEHLDP